jgi:hypothetical protein
MREAVILGTTLHYLTTGISFQDLKFKSVTPQSNGMMVLETCLPSAEKQQVNEYCAILSTDHSVYSVKFQLIDTIYCATLHY